MGGTPNLATPAPPASWWRKWSRLEELVMRYKIFLMLVLLLLPMTGAKGQLLQPDNRCFLEDGGSTLTFFIKEDLRVGEQIGRLNIQGSVGRDIDLSLNDVNGLYEQLPVELEGKYVSTF